jgi:nitrogen-specific signal transduction histidine kinase/PAS domain-containing protein
MRAYLERVLRRCTPLFAASGGSIFLKHADGVFRLETQHGIEPPIPEDATVDRGRGVAGACLDLETPLLVKDVQSESTFQGRAIEPRRELGTAMVVPLIVPDGTPIGVLNLSRKAGEPDFGQQDLEMAASLAHQVALAVGSAQLLATSEQNHAWLRGLMECMPSAVLALDPDGAILEANENGKQLLEQKPGWLTHDLTLGRNKITDPESHQIWRIDCLEAGHGRVVIAEDVTDQEYEAEMNARVRRLAEIGQMSAAVAHEIRNPLTGIRAAAQMLIQYPDQGPELAEIIDDEVARLNNLCEDFLDFARPLALERKPARLSDMVHRVVKLESAVAAQTGVEVVFEGPSETPEINIDLGRVEQVLRNLLRNAIQACQPGDKCILRLRNSAFDVEDTGSGMSEKTLKNLFVPFYTTKPKGTGLGLSTSRKIVEAHGGSMEVASRLGEGTRFTVDLRRAA